MKDIKVLDIDLAKNVFQITFRKKIYINIEVLQNDLDEWIQYYNNERTIKVKCVVNELSYKP